MSAESNPVTDALEAYSATVLAKDLDAFLDLYADDQQAEIERLVGLGARHIDWDRYPPDADWITLEDTEGNRFDVIDKSA